MVDASGSCLRAAFHDCGECPYIVPGCLQSPAITAWEQALHAKLEAHVQSHAAPECAALENLRASSSAPQLHEVQKPPKAKVRSEHVIQFSRYADCDESLRQIHDLRCHRRSSEMVVNDLPNLFKVDCSTQLVCACLQKFMAARS